MEPTASQLVVVAGASGAIGTAIVDGLKDRARIVATCRRSVVPASTSNVQWVQFDTASTAGAQPLVQAVGAVPASLTAIFFCIGLPSNKRSIANTKADEFREVYEGNVVSFIQIWQALCERARTNKASVTLIGSEAAKTLRAGNGPHSAAKVALEAVARTLAREEMGFGVRVNVVSPSLVKSPSADSILRLKGVQDIGAYYGTLPWGRALTLAEVAAAAIDIGLAPQWHYATGQVFRLGVAHDD